MARLRFISGVFGDLHQVMGVCGHVELSSAVDLDRARRSPSVVMTPRGLNLTVFQKQGGPSCGIIVRADKGG